MPTRSTVMHRLELISRSPEETKQIGAYFGRLSQPGDVFLLVGGLGAGKTCLTQGIARGLGIKEYAMSPSFVIVRELQGRLPLYHIDLYRLEGINEIADLGLDDYLYGNGVCVIEWAEKGLAVLPDEYLMVKMKFISENERRLRFTPRGKRYSELVERIREAFSTRKGGRT